MEIEQVPRDVAGLARRTGALLRGSALAILRTVLCGSLLLAALSVPLWVLGVEVVRSLDTTDVTRLSSGDIVRLVVLVGVPALLTVAAVAVATFGGSVVVLDDVRAGRRPRARRAFWHGMRSTPRLVVASGPVALVVVVLVALAPAIWIAGVVTALVTPVARRTPLAARWPSTSTLRALVIPLGPAAALAVRWSLVPTAAVLERLGPRASRRRSTELVGLQQRPVAGVLAVLLGATAATVWLAGRLVETADLSTTSGDLLQVSVQGVAALVGAAVAVAAFGAGGGHSLPSEPEPAPLPTVATMLVVSLLVGLTPFVPFLPQQRAAALPVGTTIVVDDLGDAADATPDGTCATGAGTCTLRAAVAEANLSSDEVIGFSVSGTITVASELVMTQPVVIDGDGAQVVVSGGGTSNVFRTAMEIPGGGYGAIRNLTVADGFSPVTGGAAFYIDGTSSGFVLENVTARDNVAAAGALYGGAVANLSNLTISNSTFVSNVADVTTDGSDVGNVFAGSVQILHSTFTGSTGSSSLASSGVAMDVRNSIISAPAFACSGTITGSGNVASDASGVCTGTAATAATMALAALADNGGATPTARLLPTSPAVDAGDPAFCTAVDQRGASRPLGTTCDAGAYELDPATATSLTATPNPSGYGGGVTLDATVTATGEPAIPTGSVELFDGATSLGTVALDAGGTASLLVTSLTAGPHTLTATYVPDAALASSTSPGVSQTVAAAATVVTLSSTGSPTFGGDLVTFTVDVAGAAGTVPTGSVTLLDGATTLATLTLDAAGQASHATSALAGGPHVLTATYAGDADHDPGTSTPLGHDVVALSATSLSAPLAPTTFGNDAAFDVVVTPTGGGATPTGAVTLTAGAVTLGSGTLDASGAVTIVVATLPPGTTVVTAAYSGDGYNSASTSPSVNHDVVAATTATGLTVVPSGSTVFGTLVTIEAMVTSPDSVAVPAGTVTIYDGAAPITSVTLDAAGVGTLPTSTLVSGTYALRAEYVPGTGFTASTSPTVAHDVVAATTATSLTASMPTSTFGQAVTLDAVVATLDSPRTAAGSVAFYDGAALLGVAPLDGTGAATLVTTAIGVGNRTLTAQLTGSTDFAPSTSAGVGHVVSPADVTVALVDLPDPSVFGTSFTATATVAAVAPGGGVPTGTVTLREGAVVLGTATLDGTGAVSIAISGLTVGAHTLTADYAGDGDFTPGSTTAAHTVAADTATVGVVSSAPIVAFTQPVTFTATVTGSGGAIPTGAVTFRDGPTVLGTAALDGAGVARLTTTALRFGTYPVTADYAGDAGFGAGSGSVTQQVVATGTAITLTSDTPSPTVYDLVTLTATVTGTTSTASPTGSVFFYDGATLLAVRPLDASGQATYSQSYTRSPHDLSAQYFGDPGWTNSTSGTISFITDRAPTVLTITGTPGSVTVGDAVTWTATFNSSPTGPAPSGTVSFWSGSASVGVATISGGRAVLATTTPLALGPWDVYATYVGDATHVPGSSTPASVAVAAAPTAVAVSLPTPAYARSTLILRAQVTSGFGAAPLAGTVRFTSDAPGFSPLVGTVDATGWAQVFTPLLPDGDWTLTATYEPAATSLFATSSTSTPLPIVRRPASVSLSVPSGLTVGTPFPVTFAVADLTGSGATPTGSVTVSGGGASCTATVASGSCTLVLGTAGLVPLTATYAGDAAYAAATSTAVTASVQRGTTGLRAWTTTATWATGDPVGITWQLTGPRTGEVVVRTPYGEVCRSTSVPIGSCTLTFPFSQRGQTIPVEVSFAGDATWAPAATEVRQTVVGCYQVVFEVLPASGGTISHSAGTCNGGTGHLGGSTVSAVVEPIAPYAFDHWLEDGSTQRGSTFVVGDGRRSATALMRIPCVQVTTTAGAQIDIGTGRPYGGQVDVLPPPNCPGQPSVPLYDSASGGYVRWYVPGTALTFSARPTRPEMDELKGWAVDGQFRRSGDPLSLVVSASTTVEARFGIQCVRPTFTVVGGGTVDVFTSSSCLDTRGFAWEKGSRIGARVTPDAYHWIDGYSPRGPDVSTPRPVRWPDTPVTLEGATAFWDLVEDQLDVTVTFETCRELALDVVGEGTIEVVTEPDCPTRLAWLGTYFRPGTEVELRAAPDPMRVFPNRRRLADGTVQEYNEVVAPAFLRWEDVDLDRLFDRDTGRFDPTRARLTMDVDRTATGVFYDEAACMPLDVRVHPVGAATTDVELRYDEGRCPDGEADLDSGDLARFNAVPVAGAPLVGWRVITSEMFEQVERLVWNDVPDTPIEGRTKATAYVCRAVIPKLTLIAPDGSVEAGITPPDSSFILADREGDCPLWENAYSIGSTFSLSALAPPEGYRFLRWEGGVEGTVDTIELSFLPDVVRYRSAPFEGTPGPWQEVPAGEAIEVRAVYEVICTTLTMYLGDRSLSVGPESNCPGEPPLTTDPLGLQLHEQAQDSSSFFRGGLAATEYHFIGGTPVLLDAYHLDDHDWVGWRARSGVERFPDGGLLVGTEVVEALDQGGLSELADLVETMQRPAMVTVDNDMVLWGAYDAHSWDERLADDMAVFGKKLLGFMASFAVGAFEVASGIAYARLALTIGTLLVEAIDPDATDVLAALRTAQESYDVMSLPLVCAAEWSQGTRRPDPPPNPALAPPGTPSGASALGTSNGSEVTMLRQAKNAQRVVKAEVKIAIDNYKYTAGGQIRGLGGLTRATRLKIFTKVIGSVASYGTTIYFQTVDGPGMTWEDTAAEAWEQGGEVFTDCIQRQIAEASDGHVPMPPPR